MPEDPTEPIVVIVPPVEFVLTHRRFTVLPKVTLVAGAVSVQVGVGVEVVVFVGGFTTGGVVPTTTVVVASVPPGTPEDPPSPTPISLAVYVPAVVYVWPTWYVVQELPGLQATPKVLWSPKSTRTPPKKVAPSALPLNVTVSGGAPEPGEATKLASANAGRKKIERSEHTVRQRARRCSITQLYHQKFEKLFTV